MPTTIARNPNIARGSKTVFVIWSPSQASWIDSFGIAGVTWTDDINEAFRFDTYMEAERIIENESPAGLYQIDKIFVRS